jgi:hypothetical protein
MYGVEMVTRGKIFFPNFMIIGKDVQAILKIFLSNLDGCNIGITEEKELGSASPRWA